MYKDVIFRTKNIALIMHMCYNQNQNQIIQTGRNKTE